MHRFLKILMLFMVSLLVSGCDNIDRGLMSVSNAISSPDPVTGAREITLMSEQAEIQQGLQASREILLQARQKNLKVDNQLPKYPEVQRTFNRLRGIVHRPNLPWAVHLIDQDTWNAFTVGAGKVFLFSGLFSGDAALRSEDELAVVLAHEMSHNSARHLGERQGKALLTQLADKETRNNLYQASWSRNQEHEADKFSVIYMALSGYDPLATVSVWQRMAELKGNYSTDMLHSHPLSGDRAQRLSNYAQLARQYYIPGHINPRAAQIVQCNVIYCNQRNQQAMQNTPGAGTLAFIETVANAYIETEQAKAEASRREQQKSLQMQQAAQRLHLSNLKLITDNNGSPRVSGIAENLSSQPIQHGVVGVQYYLQGKLVQQHTQMWPTMKANDRQPFNMPLKSGQYDKVKLIPEFIQ